MKNTLREMFVQLLVMVNINGVMNAILRRPEMSGSVTHLLTAYGQTEGKESPIEAVWRVARKELGEKATDIFRSEVLHILNIRTNKEKAIHVFMVIAADQRVLAMIDPERSVDGFEPISLKQAAAIIDLSQPGPWIKEVIPKDAIIMFRMKFRTSMRPSPYTNESSKRPLMKPPKNDCTFRPRLRRNS